MHDIRTPGRIERMAGQGTANTADGIVGLQLSRTVMAGPSFQTNDSFFVRKVRIIMIGGQSLLRQSRTAGSDHVTYGLSKVDWPQWAKRV